MTNAVRAPKGEGSIKPYGDGKFRVRATINGVVKTKICATKREAQRQVFIWHQESEAGTLVAGNKMILEVAIRRWLDEADHLAMSTKQSYEQKLVAYISFAPIGQMKLNNLKPVDIEDFLKSLGDGSFANAKTKFLTKEITKLNKLDPLRGLKLKKLKSQLPKHPRFEYSRSIQRQSYALIRETLKWCARSERGWVNRNVALDVVPPAAVTNARRDAGKPGATPEKHGYVLPAEHLHAILDAAKDDRLHLRWLLSLDMGLRVGEVLGLCWDDLDLDTGVLTIRRQVQHDKEHGRTAIVPRVKTPSGQREVPLPRYLVKLWEQAMDKQKRSRENIGDWVTYRFEGHPYDLCFQQPGGGVISNRLDYSYWLRLLEKTQVIDPRTGAKLGPVPKVRRYVARHSAASRMVSMPGSDILAIASILGHSSADFTLRKYSHALDESKARTAAALNAAADTRTMEHLEKVAKRSAPAPELSYEEDFEQQQAARHEFWERQEREAALREELAGRAN